MKLKKEIITSKKNINFKKISILMFISLIILGCFLPNIVKSLGHFEVKKRTLDVKSSSHEILTSVIWNSIETSQPNTLELDIDIFGYRIISTNVDPIEYDECGQLSLKKQKSEFITLELSLKFGDYKFDEILARGHLILDSTGNYIISYNLDDPMKGFFMDLHFYSNLISIVVAFDGGDSQLCYEGVYNQGYNSIPSFIPDFFEPDRMYEDLRRISEPSPQDLKDQLLRAQKTNIIISNEKYLEDNSFSINGVEGSRSISVTNYGIAHECCDIAGVDLAEDLRDDYWEPYTEIDIGIYKSKPREAIVKFDLQYYNRNWVDYPFNGYIRNIKAYAMYAESGSGENTDWLISDPYLEWLTPSEVISLWYWEDDFPYEISVYPDDMIILATVCFGYSGDDGTPHMAKAFVDNGAAAYVGATVPIPALHNDEFTEDFWYDLCQDDETVLTATYSYIAKHNSYDDYPEGYDIEWDYDDHIKIRGTTGTYLGN